MVVQKVKSLDLESEDGEESDADADSGRVNTLASPTKKGNDRELISMARDLKLAETTNNNLKDSNENLARDNLLLTEARSKLELQVHKLTKDRDKEANEHKKFMILAEKRGKELDTLAIRTDTERQVAGARMGELDNTILKQEADAKDLMHRLTTESSNLRKKIDEHGTLVRPTAKALSMLRANAAGRAREKSTAS
jgi:hypothetical protein